MKFYLTVLILAVLLYGSAYGQDEDIICVGGARFWEGSLAEIQQIEAEPIPSSFRSKFEYKGPCGSGLVRSSLLHWHRKFGTETSMEAAADYLTKGLTKTADNSANPDYKVDNYATAANYYYLAALGLDSLTMIEKAERLIVRANEIAATLPPSELGDGWGNVEFSGMREFSGGMRDYSLSQLTQDIAIQRVLVTGTRDDVLRAKSLLTEWPEQIVRMTTDAAQNSFSSICTINRVANIPNIELANACDETLGNLGTEVRFHLTRKVLLATVESRLDEKPDVYYNIDSSYDVERLLIIAEAKDCCHLDPPTYDPHTEARFRLHLAFSDLYGHFSMRVHEPADYEEKINQRDNISLALNHLLMAERYAPRYSMPSQWRRVASRYIRIAKPFKNVTISDVGDKLLQDKHILRLHSFEKELNDAR